MSKQQYQQRNLNSMQQETKKELSIEAAKGLGYAMALRRVTAWIKSGKTLEEFFDIYKAEGNLISEWIEIRDEINKIKKRK